MFIREKTSTSQQHLIKCKFDKFNTNMHLLSLDYCALLETLIKTLIRTLIETKIYESFNRKVINVLINVSLMS